VAGCAYAQLLRTPGVPRLAVSYLALGIAVTMAPVSFVLFAHRATGSFASASLVLAGGVLAAPLRGRRDRRAGRRRAAQRVVGPAGRHQRAAGRLRADQHAGGGDLHRRAAARRRDHRVVVDDGRRRDRRRAQPDRWPRVRHLPQAAIAAACAATAGAWLVATVRGGALATAPAGA
jgi:hypothetical protein